MHTHAMQHLSTIAIKVHVNWDLQSVLLAHPHHTRVSQKSFMSAPTTASSSEREDYEVTFPSLLHTIHVSISSCQRITNQKQQIRIDIMAMSTPNPKPQSQKKVHNHYSPYSKLSTPQIELLVLVGSMHESYCQIVYKTTFVNHDSSLTYTT